jgi:hypothetical protein
MVMTLISLLINEISLHMDEAKRLSDIPLSFEVYRRPFVFGPLSECCQQKQLTSDELHLK